MKHDIENRDGILLLVQQFYNNLLGDPSISYIFTHVAQIDLKHHLPIPADFWEMVLFQKDTCRKNAMEVSSEADPSNPINVATFRNPAPVFYPNSRRFFRQPHNNYIPLSCTP